MKSLRPSELLKSRSRNHDISRGLLTQQKRQDPTTLRICFAAHRTTTQPHGRTLGAKKIAPPGHFAAEIPPTIRSSRGRHAINRPSHTRRRADDSSHAMVQSQCSLRNEQRRIPIEQRWAQSRVFDVLEGPKSCGHTPKSLASGGIVRCVIPGHAHAEG